MTDLTKSMHGEWSSRFAFILAAAGSAVGLGNIWKFPYITGENGGGAFVMVYLACVFLIGIPIMMAESLLGRRSRQSPINAMQSLSKIAGADSRWEYLGWLGVTAGILILSYYSVIGGWSTAYFFKAFLGSFSGGDSRDIQELFDEFTGNPWAVLFWHTLFMLATMLVVAGGVQSGLEKSVRFLMPGLFVIIMILVGYAMTTGSYQRGLDFLFTPDFSKITGSAILTAMGHAFFTLSLGMGAIMAYGSYLPKDVSIAKTTLLIVGVDTCVALLAGIAIFPIVFENELAPGSGPGLIFHTLPIAFGKMPGGWFIGVLFFLMLVFAALTSAISLVEGAVAWLMENHGMDRKIASLWAGLTTWALGLGTVFSFNIGTEFKIFGKSIFQLLDFLTANLMLPIGGLGVAIFSGWIMSQKDTESELALSNPWFYNAWRFTIRYISPAAVFLVFLHVVGVL